jgi:hypothetical protein
MKYIFKQIDDISGANAVTTVEFNADTISDILEHFEIFLRGSGFHPSGILDFVDEEEYFPKFEPAEEDYEEEEESTVTEQWPFPLTRPTESVQQESSSDSVMDWTAAQLIRPPKMEDVCSVCKIDTQTMLNHECWDKNCPKGKDAN